MSQDTLFPKDAPPALDALATYRALAAQARAVLDAGKRLDRHEAKALREAALLDASAHVWPSRAACAHELGLTTKQLEHLVADDGCPCPPHSPIPKGEVYRWLWQRAETRAAAAPVSTPAAPIESEDDRWRRLKADQLEGKTIEEANAEASRGLSAVVAVLKGELINAFPQRLVDAIAGLDRAKAEVVARDLLKKLLSTHAAAAAKQYKDQA